MMPDHARHALGVHDGREGPPDPKAHVPRPKGGRRAKLAAAFGGRGGRPRAHWTSPAALSGSIP
jgi:hypothetical protein